MKHNHRTLEEIEEELKVGAGWRNRGGIEGWSRVEK
jgi:hypothetical protein